MQDYQKKYTANEFLALKIRGKLPSFPTAKPAPEPAAEEPVIEDEQLIEEDKTLSEAVVFDTTE